MSSGIFIAIAAQKLRIVVGYFQNRKAFSPETAVFLDENWLQTQKIDKVKLSKNSYIKATPEGKYWLDESEYLAKSKEFLYAFLAIMIILAIIVGAVVFLSYNPNVLN